MKPMEQITMVFDRNCISDVGIELQYYPKALLFFDVD